MPRNIEIKALVRNKDQLMKVAAKLSGTTGTELVQEDSFFQCPNGRLKLREQKGCENQLVFYSRPDSKGPKGSDYSIATISNAKELKDTLGKALGITGVVRKKRTLFMVGQTRIHVDEVDGLGSYMELEVQMKPNQSDDVGEETADVLMEQLGISKDDLVEGAYMDLIKRK